jgi:broad specificity phosphatase PhoE
VTTFLMVRHAAHDWLARGLAGRLPGVSLNAAGRQQADTLVQRLRGARIDALYCSPQPRTQETASPLARSRGLELGIDAAFDEVDFGEWMGRTFDEVRATGEAWTHWCEQRGSAQPPGGEAFAAVAQRAQQGLRTLRERHPDQHVLVVSHGDVIKAMVATQLGISLDHLERFEIAPASVTVLVMGDGWSRLELLNGQDTLP